MWFLGIAQDGYADATPRGVLPALPAARRDRRAAAGLAAASAAIVVSWACALVGLAVAAPPRAARARRDEAAARLAVWALALFPARRLPAARLHRVAVPALSVGAVLAARSDRWAWPALLGALARRDAQRGPGARGPARAAVVGRRAGARAHAALRSSAGARPRAASGCSPSALCLALNGTGAAAPFDAQEIWFRAFAGPFVGAWTARRPRGTARASCSRLARAASTSSRPAATRTRSPATTSRTACAGVRVPLLIGALRRLPLAYGAYAVAALALPLSYPVGPQPLMSLPRFVLVLFPLFLWLGWWLARDRCGAVALGVLRRQRRRARRLQRAVRHLALRGVGRRRCAAVLLDALGTLVGLEPARAAAAGRARRSRGARSRRRRRRRRCAPRWPTTAPSTAARPTAAGLADLRAAAPRCSRARCRPPPAGSPTCSSALLASLRFGAYPEVPEALAACGRAACGSSSAPTGTSRCTTCWRRTGLGAGRRRRGHLGRGRRRQARRRDLRRRAARRGRRRARAQALHVGDDPATDVAGARAAGIAAVLVDRSGTDPGALTSLAGVPALTG